MIRLFVLFTILGFTEIVHTELSSTPIKTNGVKLTERATIKSDDGFYNSINTFVANDGKILILDRGNFCVKVFSQDGTFLHSFGRKGEGPGEFNNRELNICSSGNQIIVQQQTKLMVFDLNGNLLHEIKENTYGAKLFPTKKGFRYLFRQEKNPKYASKEFDFNGKVIAEITNPKYDPSNKASERDFFDLVKRADEITHLKSKLGTEIHPYKNKYIQLYKGPYKFDILDESFNVSQSVTRPFTKVTDKFDYKHYYTFVAQNYNEKYRDDWINACLTTVSVNHNLFNGNKDDLQEIIGTYNDYIFLSVASKKDYGYVGEYETFFKRDFIIDVISPELSYYTSFNIKDLNLSYANEIIWMKMYNNRLVLELHNEDDGFYVKVMDINLL